MFHHGSSLVISCGLRALLLATLLFGSSGRVAGQDPPSWYVLEHLRLPQASPMGYDRRPEWIDLFQYGPGFGSIIDSGWTVSSGQHFDELRARIDADLQRMDLNLQRWDAACDKRWHTWRPTGVIGGVAGGLFCAKLTSMSVPRGAWYDAGPMCCDRCFETLFPGQRKGRLDCRCFDLLSVPGRSVCRFVDRDGRPVWVVGDGGGPVALPGTDVVFNPPNGAGVQVAALLQYWNGQSEDAYTSSTAWGYEAFQAAGYHFVRVEGYVFSTQQPGTVPLKLYWHAGRGDTFTTASATGEQAAIGSGYVFSRIEGYVYPDQRPGSVPLKNYWNNDRGDNFTTATPESEQSALGSGYQLAWVEGYLLGEVNLDPPPPDVYLGPPPGDQGGLVADDGSIVPDAGDGGDEPGDDTPRDGEPGGIDTQRWAGTWQDASGRRVYSISGQGGSLSGSYQYNLPGAYNANARGGGSFSNCKPDGERVVCDWTGSHEDDHKTISARGVMILKLSGDRLTATAAYVDDSSTVSWKGGAPLYDPETTKGYSSSVELNRVQ
jgi:hypothetical protein